SAGDYIAVDASDGVAYPVWADNRESPGTMKVYVSPIQLWGITQSSISASYSIVAPGVLNVSATWSTDLWSDGVDDLILTSPTNVQYAATASPPSATTIHSAVKECACETGLWTYMVKSTRAGYTPSQSANQAKTLLVEPFVSTSVPQSVAAASRGVAWGDYD